MMKKTKAFTLIEVLLGLTIFSIIALSLYSTFSSGIQLSRRSDQANRIYREARWFFDRLTLDLENMQTYSFDNSYPQLVSFAGTQDAITLILPTSQGLKSVSYVLRDPQNDSVYKTIIGKRSARPRVIVSKYEEKMSWDLLVREEKSFADYLQQLPELTGKREVLSSHIQPGSLKFSYAYLEKQGEKTEMIWKDAWNQRYLPSGVRVTATFINPDPSKEPVTLDKDIFIPTGFLGEEGS